MIWLSPNEGHLRQTNVTICLLRINLCRVTRIYVLKWLQPAIAAINQYACCKNTYFVGKSERIK